MKKSGRILIVAELAREYEFKDVGGVLVYLVSIQASLIEPWSHFVEMRTIQNTHGPKTLWLAQCVD